MIPFPIPLFITICSAQMKDLKNILHQISVGTLQLCGDGGKMPFCPSDKVRSRDRQKLSDRARTTWHISGRPKVKRQISLHEATPHDPSYKTPFFFSSGT